MAVSTTLEIPDALHDRLRQKAEESGVPIGDLIVQAIEHEYGMLRQARLITGPLILDKGPRGPLYPTDENPHDLILP
jgi:hypothetical protein